jgi:hypothetical protein
MMAGAAQAFDLCFGKSRLHDVRRRPQEFYAISARSSDRVYPAPGLFRSADAARCVHLDRKTRIGGNARGDDLVGCAPATLAESPAKPIEGAGLAHGRDAMPEPELVHVFRRRDFADLALPRIGYVRMCINESRQHVHACRIDFVVSLFRPVALVNGHFGIPDTDDTGNLVILDHDIDRPNRRCAGAVNHSHATYDQTLEGTRTFTGLARGRRFRRVDGPAYDGTDVFLSGGRPRRVGGLCAKAGKQKHPQRQKSGIHWHTAPV